MTNCTNTISRPSYQDARMQTIEGLKLFAKGVSLFAIVLVDRLVDAQEQRRTSDQLAQFDERMLKDIGLTPSDVEALRQAEQARKRVVIGKR